MAIRTGLEIGVRRKGSFSSSPNPYPSRWTACAEFHQLCLCRASRGSGGIVNQTQLELGGRTLKIETGRVAQQASGAVTVRMGDTMLLVTATMSATPREGIDFFPLTCDYEEKLYAAGKIPGGFIRREGRPSEQAILMVEAGAKEVSEEQIVEALRMAHREIVRICEMQDAFAREVGKPKVVVVPTPTDPEVDQALDRFLAERLDQALFNPNKSLRESALDDLKKETITELGPQFADRLPYLAKCFEAKVKQRVRHKILDEGRRPDWSKRTESRTTS